MQVYFLVGGGGVISDLELSSIWIITIGVKVSTEGQEVPPHIKQNKTFMLI
jgi:hypothetical protein